MNPDHIVNSTETSQESLWLLTSLTPRIKKREESIIAGLVASSEGGLLTENAMRSGIAGIAALRSLLRDIERENRLAHSQANSHRSM